MEAPDFWDDSQKSQHIIQNLKQLKASVEGIKKLEEMYEDAQTLIEMGYEENDESIVEEVKTAIEDFIKSFEDMRVATL